MRIGTENEKLEFQMRKMGFAVIFYRPVNHINVGDSIVDNITVNITDSNTLDDVVDDVESGNSIGVNVGVNGNGVGVNETQLRITSLLLENPHITAQKLSELLGITKRRVESNLKRLKELGIIKRVGAEKNGHWVVLQKGGRKSV